MKIDWKEVGTNLLIELVKIIVVLGVCGALWLAATMGGH